MLRDRRIPDYGEETGGDCGSGDCREDEDLEERLDVVGCLFGHLCDVLHLGRHLN